MSKRSLQSLLAFVLLVVGMDRALGALLGALHQRTFTGERAGLLNLALSQSADILVLGSSRAQYQVMPSVLARELPGKIYNAGLKGHDLLYASMLLDLWERRHPAPRAVILNVDMESLLRRPNELAAAQIFAPYLDESARVREVLYQGGVYKRLAYVSRAYRYNGRVLGILKNLMRAPDPQYDGYLPAPGRFDPRQGVDRHGLMDMPVSEPPSDAVALRLAEAPYWDFKLELLEGLARSAQHGGYRLFLVHSPVYGLHAQAHGTWLRRMQRWAASQPAVSLLDLCEHAHPRELASADLFMNFNHLNVAGARTFSALLGAAVARELARAPSAPAVRAGL